MRKYLIAGNWKMNLLRNSSKELVQQIRQLWKPMSHVEIAVCPPSVYLADVLASTQGSDIGVGAQNMYHLAEGAYTGEISGKMLSDIGCRYVILGHSERRQLMGETDASVNAKTLAAFQYGLTPIVCVGETLEQREAGQTKTVVETQCRGSLAGLSVEQMSQTVIAYEPVWAIGTGRTASPNKRKKCMPTFENSWFPFSVPSVLRRFGFSMEEC